LPGLHSGEYAETAFLAEPDLRDVSEGLSDEFILIFRKFLCKAKFCRARLFLSVFWIHILFVAVGFHRRPISYMQELLCFWDELCRGVAHSLSCHSHRFDLNPNDSRTDQMASGGTSPTLSKE